MTRLYNNIRQIARNFRKKPIQTVKKDGAVAYLTGWRITTFRYDDLLKEMEKLADYGVKCGSVGKSVLGQDIPYAFVGEEGGDCLLVQGAMHAREHVTALLVLCQIKHLVKNKSLKLCGGIYFVPMTNPDGVRLAQEGAGFVEDGQRRSFLRALNGGNGDFSLWKANADGVDVNVNFDARWGEGEQNVFAPAPENYVGEAPFSSPEAAALADFTRSVSPVATLSYHAKGEVVFWEFGQTSHRRFRDRRYAEAICRQTGYRLVDGDCGSAGGYKDWCVDKLKIPAYTVEVGEDDLPHPLPYAAFEKILRANVDLPRKLLNTVSRDKRRVEQQGLTSLFDD